MSEKRSPSHADNMSFPREKKETSPQKLYVQKIRREDSKDVNCQNGKVGLTVPSQSIVDELFKDFISKKQCVPTASRVSMTAKPLAAGSIDKMSAILDREISLIGTKQKEPSPVEQEDVDKEYSSSKRKHKKKRKHETPEERSERKHRHKEKKRKRERECDHPTFEDIHGHQDSVEDSYEAESDSRHSRSRHKMERNSSSDKSKNGLELLSQYSENSELNKGDIEKRNQKETTDTPSLFNEITKKASVDALVFSKKDTGSKVESFVNRNKLYEEARDEVQEDRILEKDKVDTNLDRDNMLLLEKVDRESQFLKEKVDKVFEKVKADKSYYMDTNLAKDKVDRDFMNKDKIDKGFTTKDRVEMFVSVEKVDKSVNKDNVGKPVVKDNVDLKDIIIIIDDNETPEKVSTVASNTGELKTKLWFSSVKPGNASAVNVSSQKVNMMRNAFDLESIPLPSPHAKSKPVMSKLGIKIGSDIAEFIASGEKIDKKGKRREEGEVISSGSENDTSNNEDDDEDDDDNKVSETGSLPETDDEKNSIKGQKKKKKHKHKKKKSKKNKEKDKSEKKKKKDSKSREEFTEKIKSKNRDKDRYRSRSRSRSRSRHKSTSNDVLDRGWDAYSYMQDFRRASDAYKNFETRRHRHDTQSRSRSPSRSRSKHKTRHRSRSYSRSRRKSRSRSRSRSRKDTHEEDDLRIHIDKKKLRKIAITNALASLKSGNMNSADLASLKSGGKSVEELTEYCKGLAGGDHGEFSSTDSDSDSKDEDEQDHPFINHPFIVREAPAIIMNIRNAKQLPTMTQSEKTVGVLRSQFPVSSGNQHRLKELEWVPVEKTTPAPATVSVPTSTVVVSTTTSTTMTSSDTTISTPPPLPPPPPPPVSTVIIDPVFPKPVAMAIDIGAIVSERLQAVRKLQENPYDVQALTRMHKSQEKASQWATSQYQPGQFTGSTGVQILTKQELEGGNKYNRAWLRKDQFKKAEPVKSGIGMFLLQKMGWKAGEGLGKNNEGSLEPLLLDLKVDRKGLQTQSDLKFNQQQRNVKNKGRGGGGGGSAGAGAGAGQALPKDLSGKHPVSALLEICNRRKFGAPNFELIHESGPDHKKNFLFKVLVNGTEYQPSIASNNKKTAKMQAATVCLQELGMVPRQGPI